MKETKKRRRKHKRLRRTLIFVLMLLVAWTLWSSLTLQVTERELSFSHLPEAFDSIKVAVLSDLHFKSFGVGSDRVLQKLKAENPDLIAFTGDLVDAGHTDISAALSFVGNAVQVAPCYYVTGNHEASLENKVLSSLLNGLQNAGVQVLRNKATTVTIRGDKIRLVGLDDPAFQNTGLFHLSETILYESLRRLMPSDGMFTLVLSHRPEAFSAYAQLGADAVLSGHTHGGLLRLPVVGALYAPDQGFLPRYDAGVFREGATTMIVSRGIGNSVVPFRFNSPPELVVLTLRR